MDAARTQFDKEEHIDGLNPDGFNSEKVASQNLFFVVGVGCKNSILSNLLGETRIFTPFYTDEVFKPYGLESGFRCKSSFPVSGGSGVM